MKRKRIDGWFAVVGASTVVGTFDTQAAARKFHGIASQVRLREVLPAEDALVKAALEWSKPTPMDFTGISAHRKLTKAVERYRKAVK